jgi:hypothetical protein
MADTATTTKWHYKGTYLEYCNCAYGCPCNFSGFPTHGNCRAVIGMHLDEGSAGDVDLGGVTFVGIADWPKAIHDGNGTIAVFFDTSTSEEQVAALAGIMMGQHGGLPWEILSTTIANVLGPFVEPIEMNIDGRRSTVKIGDKVAAAMTPHVNPVDPSEETDIHVVNPTGFIWTDGQAARNVGVRVNVDGMSFEDKDSNAFYTTVEHSN